MWTGHRGRYCRNLCEQTGCDLCPNFCLVSNFCDILEQRLYRVWRLCLSNYLSVLCYCIVSRKRLTVKADAGVKGGGIGCSAIWSVPILPSRVVDSPEEVGSGSVAIPEASLSGTRSILWSGSRPSMFLGRSFLKYQVCALGCVVTSRPKVNRPRSREERLTFSRCH